MATIEDDLLAVVKLLVDELNDPVRRRPYFTWDRFDQQYVERIDMHTVHLSSPLQKAAFAAIARAEGRTP